MPDLEAHRPLTRNGETVSNDRPRGLAGGLGSWCGDRITQPLAHPTIPIKVRPTRRQLHQHPPRAHHHLCRHLDQQRAPGARVALPQRVALLTRLFLYPPCGGPFGPSLSPGTMPSAASCCPFRKPCGSPSRVSTTDSRSPEVGSMYAFTAESDSRSSTNKVEQH